MKEKIFTMLKPKAASFGFNEEELKGVIDIIADKLPNSEEATEEQINGIIDSVIPFLQVAQKNASRVISKAKAEFDAKVKKIKDEIDQDYEGKKNPKPKDEKPDWFREFETKMEQRFAKIDSENIAKNRKEQLETLLKDSGFFGKQTIKSFEKMKFETEDEFQEFLEDTKTDLKAYNEEREKYGFNVPPIGGGGGKNTPPEKDVLTDEEVANLASSF